MKAVLEKLTPGWGSSLSVMQLSMDRFEGPYHYHPELELTWIIRSRGKRYVGGNVSDYEPGDLVLLGSRVPHCWRSTGASEPGDAQAIVIQFLSDFAGSAFLELPEMRKIRNLFCKAAAGMVIKGSDRDEITSLILQCASAEGVSRLIGFIGILDLITNSKDYEEIDPLFAARIPSNFDTERFQKVLDYLIENYQVGVSLNAAAKIASLTPAAFCRYFKNVTRKTMVEMLNEFRINHARQLLRSSGKPVAEICFECGFGNVSYFNKTFKTLSGYTPMQYRNMFSDG